MDRKSNFTREQFVHYLRAQGMRATPERLAIFDAINALTKPFDLNDLNCSLSNSGFRVSVATLYNNINLLVDAAIIRRLPPADDKLTRYEKATGISSHMRLTCMSCGSTREFRSVQLSQQIRQLQFKTFDPRNYVITIYGLCKKCQQNKKSTNKTIYQQ